MTSATMALRAAKSLGLRSSAHFLYYQTVLKSGWIRRQTPVRSWQSFQLADWPIDTDPSKGNFFWQTDRWSPPGHLSWSQSAKEQAEQNGLKVLRGIFPLFHWHWVDLGFPPKWHSFPRLAGGSKAPAVEPEQHWSTYSLDELGADIKLLWEPSRMGWIYTLGRAYRWTENDQFAEGWWRLLEDWCRSHQPNAGPHWVSAQEVAFRIVALGFAKNCFDPWLTRSQQQILSAVVRAHAVRIPPTIAYSRAQRNNHLLSEAVGLLTAGLLFPELPEARKWRRYGFRWLVDGLDDQIFEDGGYIQHSINYARLTLELGLWSNVLCKQNGLSLPDRSLVALSRLTDWLSDMVEPTSGHSPNFGPNDGTQLLSLTSCQFSDYRPTLQAARAILGGKAPYGEGLWDELTSWLGTESLTQQVVSLPARINHPQAGIYSVGSDKTYGYLRAVEFSSRPGHVDQLHLDLWRRGRNLALDPGTYLYNGDPPWDNQLAGAKTHNTIVLDGLEPMTKASRFLWLNWSRARLSETIRSEDGELELISAVHDGYKSIGVRHQRNILRAGDDLILVVDNLSGEGEHEVHLPWLLPKGEWVVDQGILKLLLEGDRLQLIVKAPGITSSLFSAGARVFGGELSVEIPQWGWHSPSYALKQPALHWISQWRGLLPVQILSWWCFNDSSPSDLELRWQDGPLPHLRTVHFGGATLRR